jgi:alkylation response protein AidB-like acyl-CoA dehydrogenase
MSAVDYCICIEELARVCPAIGAVGGRPQRPVHGAHRMFGTEAQKQTYLPPLVRGKCSARGG